MTSGWHTRVTVFQEIRRGADFDTGDFVREKGVGGGGLPQNDSPTSSLDTTTDTTRTSSSTRSPFLANKNICE